jgi:FixJ family two-component response regulator
MTPTHAFIIDDDCSFGISLKRLLDARGIPSEYFRSARSFLDSVSAGQQGWAIVDIHMPECNGFALIDKMHELHFDMPVILITGQSQTDARELAMKKGAVGYLQKPFSEESLLELMNQDREI